MVEQQAALVQSDDALAPKCEYATVNDVATNHRHRVVANWSANDFCCCDAIASDDRLVRARVHDPAIDDVAFRRANRDKQRRVVAGRHWHASDRHWLRRDASMATVIVRERVHVSVRVRATDDCVSDELSTRT